MSLIRKKSYLTNDSSGTYRSKQETRKRSRQKDRQMLDVDQFLLKTSNKKKLSLNINTTADQWITWVV